MTRPPLEAAQSGREITISRYLDAPIAIVWKAITDPRHVAHWWGPFGFTTVIETMDVRPGARWRFTMRGPDGVEYPNEVLLHEVTPHERLAFAHGAHSADEPLFETEITFAPEGAGTRFTLEQTHPSEERAKTVASYAIDGGRQTVTRLQGYLEAMRERAGESVLEGAAHATDEQDFVIVRVFDAPRALVYRAMTEAERLAKWFGPVGMGLRVVVSDPRPGGQFRYAMQAGPNEMCGRFVYREAKEPERLAYVVSFTDSAFEPVRHPMSDQWPLEVLAIASLTELDRRTLLVSRSLPIHAQPHERALFLEGRSGMLAGTHGMYDHFAEYLATLPR
jgi:uncharacterized protein YndB with AHSA1/START domain